MTKEFIFVGERRSKTAIERGWTWEDGHPAARGKIRAKPVYKRHVKKVLRG